MCLLKGIYIGPPTLKYWLPKQKGQLFKMGQPTKHYLWEHITDMKWKFWWKPVRSVGSPGDPCISSKLSPWISLVGFTITALLCSVVWMFSLPCPFSPFSFFPLTNVHVLYGSVPQPWLWSNWASSSALLAFWAFPEQGGNNNGGFISSRLQRSRSVLLCDRRCGEWGARIVVTHIHIKLCPYHGGCYAFCVNQASVGPIPLDGTWIVWLFCLALAHLDSAFQLFGQWQRSALL